ncbi:uncharacterized protein [Melanerpes formicivorus]|uniref:uncharacterized protein n=1 Tax=Melanerpes formicivorus TaxID=211600 RepID=UPI00358FD028
MAGGSVQGLPGHFLADSVALPWLLSPKARPPEWETAQEFEDLLERHSQCDAQHCLCPGGRGQAEEEGPWQLLLCSSCAAEGTHRCCSQLEDSTALWECHGCAGPSNASSATLQEAGPSTPRQPTQASSRASEAAEGCSSPSGPMRLRDRHEAVEKFVRENTQHNLQHPLVVCSVGETSDPEAMEQACWLCCQANADENICGIWKQHQDVCFHACCVYFANSVTPVAFSGDIPAFHLSAIRRAIQLSAEQLCFVCGGSGASITCQESGCERSFHLPCATRGRCVTQYFEQYR